MRTFIPAITIKAMLAGLAELGMEPEQLLVPTGYTRERLQEPFAAVPEEVFGQVWKQAFLIDPAPDLPIRAAFAVPDGAFGLFDHLTQNAQSVGEALHILNLFFWLVSTGISLKFTHDDQREAGDWVWLINTPELPTSQISDQWTSALCVQRLQQAIQQPAVAEIRLTFPQESYTALFTKQYQLPVQLNQPRSGFRLLDGMWEKKIPTANSQLHETLLAVAEAVEIKQFESAPLTYAIRTRLPEALQENRFSVEEMAQELGLSRRTLHRQLAAEAMTFTELLDWYRQEEAMAMLQRGIRSMSTVAYALGYSEQSSFNRAFKRWTGESPSRWLQEHARF